MNHKEIYKLLNKQDLAGFTVVVKGELKRYVVALTNNTNIYDIEDLTKELEAQVKENTYKFNDITIGGWKDTETGKVYIDVGTTTDSLDYAINIAKYNKQIAIWDSVEQKEITIKY